LRPRIQNYKSQATNSKQIQNQKYKSFMTTALLLIAHGSRQPEANADLDRLAAELRQRGDYPIVEPSFLEIAEPTIPQGGGRCVQQGASRVILAPYFLAAGRHVREDLTRYREELAARFPQTDFVLAEPLGPHPLLMDIVLERAKTANEGSA
jgi:sirohydrochlorin ferrochelatase